MFILSLDEIDIHFKDSLGIALMPWAKYWAITCTPIIAMMTSHCEVLLPINAK